MSTNESSAQRYADVGAMPGRIEPVRSRTTPARSNSGSIDSITENTASFSATSTIWPRPVARRDSSATSAPMTPYSADSVSPIDTPTRDGGRSGVPVT